MVEAVDTAPLRAHVRLLGDMLGSLGINMEDVGSMLGNVWAQNGHTHGVIGCCC